MKNLFLITFLALNSIGAWATGYECVGAVNATKTTFVMQRENATYAYGQVDFADYFISIDENTTLGDIDLTVNFLKHFRPQGYDASIALAVGIVPPAPGKSFTYSIQNDGNEISVRCRGL